MFAHDLEVYTEICRLFDYLLASHPIAVVYMPTALILQNKTHIIQECDDIGMLHMYFAAFKSVDAEELIAQTESLLKAVPPEDITPGLGVLDDSPMNYRPLPSPELPEDKTGGKWLLPTGRNIVLGITSMGAIAMSLYAKSIFGSN